MSINSNHCLRRQFTENILTHLQKGYSVNVVVPKVGEDADRFVKDIQQCELPEIRVLVVNMRSCRGSYQQFLLDLWQQYQQQPLKEPPDLFQVLSDLEQAEQPFIIVLNHFDAMCADDVDTQFVQDFYIHLNSLKNYRHVALLVMTKGTSYHGMSFNIGGEFKTSKLDIQEIEELPALTGDEVRYELTSRHPELSGVHISHMMAQIQQGASYDYACLDYLSRQLKHSTQPWDDMSHFIRQLKSWYKQYKRLQSKQAGYHAKKFVGGADKLSSIFIGRYLKIRLDDPENPAGYLQAGRLGVGQYFEPENNVSWSQPLSLQSKQAGYHAKKFVGGADKLSSIFKVKAFFNEIFLVVKVYLGDLIISLIELFKEGLNKKKR